VKVNQTAGSILTGKGGGGGSLSSLLFSLLRVRSRSLRLFRLPQFSFGYFDSRGAMWYLSTSFSLEDLFPDLVW
jgi:hypothetical protein